MTDLDPSIVIELIDAFRRSKVMFTAVSLGLFDRLTEGPKDAGTLASLTRTDPGALERLLNACVAMNLVTKQDGSYANLPVSETYLARSSPSTLSGYILYSNRSLYPLWGHLDDAIRDGSNRWQETFGSPGSIFDHFFESEEAKRDFLAGMHGFGLLSSPRVAAAFDLAGFDRLVDLGGATGHLAIEICKRHPNVRAAVFDLPGVAELAGKYISRSGMANRIAFIAGDFFQDPLPEADLFTVGRVLHDWSEERICTLLHKIHDRLPGRGALLIAERLLDEDKTGPLSSLLQSLNMLVCTEGKERTFSEYEAILRETGFAEVHGRKTGGTLDAILAVKGEHRI
ncbi:MAG TPA: class I SAM-dependent methyltransferase [Terriglobia bacterium]|nr:class I SAM-dependent methyltransferase [Terriglobia bacterium]